MEVLKNFSFVKAKKLTPAKAQFLEELKEAVEELNQIKAGEKRGRRKSYWMSYKVISISKFDKQAKRLAGKYPSLRKD